MKRENNIMDWKDFVLFCFGKISKLANRFETLFETIPNLEQPIEKCVNNLLSSLTSDLGKTVKAIAFFPVYYSLKVIFSQFNDYGKVPEPLITFGFGKQNTKTVSNGIRSF